MNGWVLFWCVCSYLALHGGSEGWSLLFGVAAAISWRRS